MHLEGLTGLGHLDLKDTQVTDAGLVHLEGLTNLKSLDLRYTQVSDAGVARLKRALPKLHDHQVTPRPSCRRCGSAPAPASILVESGYADRAL